MASTRGAMTAGAGRDALLIAGLMLLSAVLYTGGLGFYSDDWAIIALFRTGHPVAVALDWLRYRPGQALDLALTYSAFGLEPLGYHVVNGVVLGTGGVLFYAVLRECGQPRAVALAVALLFLLLPHYATARFWWAASAAGVSMAAYFASLAADLRALRPGRLPWPAWKALALLALLASIATYEVFLPLFLLNPLLVWWASRQPGREPLGARRALALALPGLVLLVAVSLYKAAVATRETPATLYAHVAWFALLLWRASVNAVAGDFGAGLPRFVAGIARDYPDPRVLSVAVLAGAAAFAGLWGASRGDAPRPRAMLALVGLGAVVFVGGYAIFLTNFNASISSTGPNNRVSMAATAGIALALTGLLGWVSCLARDARVRRAIFAGSVAVLAAAGVGVVNTIARFWVAASAEQQRVVARIRADLPALAPGTALLLDGACPSVGPAPVFETSWDLGGALRVAYDDPTLSGDVVTAKLEIAEEGLYTRMYGSRAGPYAWDSVLVYDVASGRSTRLDGPFAAARYFEAWNARQAGACRSWREGFGSPLFVEGEPPVALGPR